MTHMCYSVCINQSHTYMIPPKSVDFQEQVLTDAIELFLDVTRSDAQGIVEAMDEAKRDSICEAISKVITESLR